MSIVLKHFSIKSFLAYFLITGMVIGIGSCTSREEKFPQNNPCDPGGNNWTVNSPPVIIAVIDSNPLWHDYDFQSNTGTIMSVLTVYDKNSIYDTLTIAILLGTHADSLDTVYAVCQFSIDSAIQLRNLHTATTYYYKCIATDTREGIAVSTGKFITPRGRPPVLIDSILVTGSSSSISLTWYGQNTYSRYTLYRAKSQNGPFAPILDTITPWTYVNYSDYVPDYSVYYYAIASVNEYGECRSHKTICSYRYSSSISSPSSVSASDGTYTDYIYLSWSSVYSAKKYFIYRSHASSVGFFLIDSTTYTYYRDTIRDTSTQLYYRISAADSYGQQSALSSSNGGYVEKLSSPFGISASDGTSLSAISVSWGSVSGAAGYYVYRSLSDSGPYELIATVESTTWNDSVTTMDTYYYKVAAYDAFKRAGMTSTYNTGYILRTLAAPSSITASRGTDENCITVSWTPVSNASGYAVYRSTSTVLNSFLIIDSTLSASYSDSVFTDEHYYYIVAAYDSLGRLGPKSDYTYGYILQLNTPSTPSVSQGTYYNHIEIQWSAVTGAHGYFIYRSDLSTGNPYELIDSSLSTQYRDSSITDTITYYYKIAAYTAKGKTSKQSYAGTGYLKRFSFPTNIVASLYEFKNKIVLQWDSVPSATGYAVYRSTPTSGIYNKIASTTIPSYNDFALDSNWYYYKISSLQGIKESPQSSSVIGFKLGPPTKFTAAGNWHSIGLSWNTIGNTAIKGYYLYRSMDGISFVRRTVIHSSSIASFQDSVTDYSKYYYKISSFSLSEESDYSPVSQSMRRPSQPLNLHAQPNTSHVALTWNPAAGAESYRVYRGTFSATQTFLAMATQPVYNDSSLTTSTKYYYTVSAINAGGESYRSNYVYAGIILKPSVPVNLTATGSTAHIYLQWSQNANDTVFGHVIYRSDDSGSAYVAIDTVTKQYYYDSVTNGQRYYYLIATYNSAGMSDRTTPVSSCRLPPSTPLTVSAESEQYTTHIPVKWSSSTGANGYHVYRAVSADSNYQKITTTALLMYNDSTVQNDSIYYYRISAYNPAGESALSSYVSAKKLSIRTLLGKIRN